MLQTVGLRARASCSQSPVRNVGDRATPTLQASPRKARFPPPSRRSGKASRRVAARRTHRWRTPRKRLSKLILDSGLSKDRRPRVSSGATLTLSEWEGTIGEGNPSAAIRLVENVEKGQSIGLAGSHLANAGFSEAAHSRRGSPEETFMKTQGKVSLVVGSMLITYFSSAAMAESVGMKDGSSLFQVGELARTSPAMR